MGMAARTVLREELRSLTESVVADQLHHAGGRNPLRSAGQFDRPRGVGLGQRNRVEERLRVADSVELLHAGLEGDDLRGVVAEMRRDLRLVVLGLLQQFLDVCKGAAVGPEGRVVFIRGHGGEQADARQQREGESHVEPVAELPAAEDRHQEHDPHDQARHHDRAEEFAACAKALEDFEKLEQKQEIPFGPRGRVGQRRISWGTELRAEFARHDRPALEHGAKRRHQDHPQHHGHDRQHRHGVFEHLVGPKHRVGPDDRLLRAESVLAKEREVHHEHQHERDRQEAGMDREEPRERVMTVVGAAHDHLLERGADERHEPRQIRGHAGGPVALLVPGEQVAGERHAEDEHHEHKPQPEIHLARRAVGAVDHDLHKVEGEQHDHRLGHHVMDAAEQPAAGHLVLDVVDALPRRLGAGRIARPEHETGDDLRHKREDERAAPDIPPACAARHPLVEGLLHDRAIAGAVVEKVGQLAEHARTTDGTRGHLFLIVLMLRFHGRATLSAMPV